MSEQRTTRGKPSRIQAHVAAPNDDSSSDGAMDTTPPSSSRTAAPKSVLTDGAIDTHKLGGEPLGPQRGKNGPQKTKFICSRCRKHRWISDSDAGSAANLHRLSMCGYCDIRSYIDGMKQEL